jgi:hypothetical protein
MKKKYLFLFPALLFTSIIMASEEPDDGTNTKTPHDASKIIPGSEEMEKHSLNESNASCRIGRKRRRQSACSEHTKMMIRSVTKVTNYL